MNIPNATQQTHCNINQVPSHEQLQKALRKRKNQKQEILKHLQDHGSISTIEAHKMFILAPAARILELREQGYDITTIQNYSLNGLATYFLNNSKVMK